MRIVCLSKTKVVGSQGTFTASEVLPSTYELGTKVVREQNVEWDPSQ